MVCFVNKALLRGALLASHYQPLTLASTIHAILPGTKNNSGSGNAIEKRKDFAHVIDSPTFIQQVYLQNDIDDKTNTKRLF